MRRCRLPVLLRECPPARAPLCGECALLRVGAARAAESVVVHLFTAAAVKRRRSRVSSQSRRASPASSVGDSSDCKLELT